MCLALLGQLEEIDPMRRQRYQDIGVLLKALRNDTTMSWDPRLQYLKHDAHVSHLSFVQCEGSLTLTRICTSSQRSYGTYHGQNTFSIDGTGTEPDYTGNLMATHTSLPRRSLRSNENSLSGTV